jgi:hypothetical protein
MENEVDPTDKIFIKDPITGLEEEPSIVFSIDSHMHSKLGNIYLYTYHNLNYYLT